MNLNQENPVSGLKRLLTAKEAAEYLGISTKTLWEWTEKGILPRVEIPGTKSKYDLQDLENLIQENKIYATQAASETAERIIQSTDKNEPWRPGMGAFTIDGKDS